MPLTRKAREEREAAKDKNVIERSTIATTITGSSTNRDILNRRVVVVIVARLSLFIRRLLRSSHLKRLVHLK